MRTWWRTRADEAVRRGLHRTPGLTAAALSGALSDTRAHLFVRITPVRTYHTPPLSSYLVLFVAPAQVATAHGGTLANVIKNPTLADLVRT
jgi:hypothetical protein